MVEAWHIWPNSGPEFGLYPNTFERFFESCMRAHGYYMSMASVARCKFYDAAANSYFRCFHQG